MPQKSNAAMYRAPLVSRLVRYGVWSLLGIVLVFPLWAVKYPPVVDYPDHLARAYVLHHLTDPHHIFGQWYASDWGPNPYLVVDLLLQALQFPFGIYVAGKIVLTICVVSLPLATWFFLKRANPGSEYLALWSLVVAYNTNFLMGFLSFELSIALCFLAVAVWLGYLESRKPATWCGLLALVTVLYFTHLGGFAIAGVILTLYTILKFRSFIELLKSWLLFLPGAAFFLNMKMHSWSQRGFDYSSWHLSAKLVTLTTPLRGYSRTIDGLTLLIVAISLFLAFRNNNERRVQNIWILIALAIVAIHLVVPDRYGDLASIDNRFPPFAFLAALAIPYFGKRKLFVICCALSVFLLRTGNTAHQFIAEQGKLDKLAAGFDAVPRQSVVLAFSAPPAPTDLYVDHDELHFWAYGIIDRGWVSPTLFHQKGVQPIAMRRASYLGDDPKGGYTLDHPLNWGLIADQYDFIWAYDVPLLDPPLVGIARVDYEADKLKVFEIRKEPRTVGSGGDSESRGQK